LTSASFFPSFKNTISFYPLAKASGNSTTARSSNNQQDSKRASI